MYVFVYDTTRGVREGEELDKLLAFYPASASAEQQQAAAGLAEALAGLSSIFSAGVPLQSLTAVLHRHAFLPCEPGLWFSLVRPQAHRPPVALSTRRWWKTSWRRTRRFATPRCSSCCVTRTRSSHCCTVACARCSTPTRAAPRLGTRSEVFSESALT